ncbi:MAG: toprim domain-containing protein [Deltaproteobacteria bacterium]|nr:toprim domain-containing protein [Deltaproteobacteria bacterium]
MARIPSDELQRLKSEISVERLVAERVKLEKRGQDLAGRCPFHEGDNEPSLVVTPAKNLWHCFGCGAGGDVIEWVRRTEGVSFRHAVELLREGKAGGGEVVKVGTVRKLPPPVSLDADDEELLRQVVDYYHRALLEEPEALAYATKKRGLSREAIEHFKLGFSNRTLGLRLPQNNRVDGAAVRTRLMKLGVLRESGHEHLRGSLVVPILGEAGAVRGMYGRKIQEHLRAGTPLHLYLPGPHRGVFNADGLKGNRDVVLCESLIDALTFWSAGIKNVTTSYGVEGFTGEMLAALKKHGVERVVIAYDRDDAGDRAATELSERLKEGGFAVARALFPRHMDANEYALKVTPATKSLRLVIERAWFEGKPSTEVTTSPAHEPARAAKEEAPSTPLAAKPPARADDVLHGLRVDVKGDGDEVVMTAGDRCFRARGIKKNLSHEVLRINLMVQRDESFYVDTLDLYAARQRTAFLQQAARELGLDVEVLRRDLGRVLLVLEERNEAAIKDTLEPAAAEATVMTNDERAEALALLQDKNLIGRILEDFERCGVVGEQTNKLVGFLAAVSRRLEDPLAIVVQSTSAAGKSALMEAVLAFIPQEEKVKYSAMTGQSLFYMGGTDLKHKVLAIVEEEGAERASYALKLLQSEGELTIASTGKDPQTGKLITHEYKVEGPVMIFLTTTAIEIDEELLNRCIVLTVDEDRAQTRAIHAIQRRRQTLEGLLAKEERNAVVRLHQNAQRLVQPLLVANPFAEKLTFLDDKTRTRRDHMKYLTLIRTIALVHQHQRTIKTVQHRGQVLEYLEATLDDVALANVLCHDVLGRSLDELPPQTRKLLVLLDEMVKRQCAEHQLERTELRFTRRDALMASGFSLTQLRVHLERLVELELVLVHRGLRGQSFVYELVWDGDGAEKVPRLPGLLDVEALGGSGMTQRWRGLLGSWRGDGGAKAGGWRGDGAPPVVDDKPRSDAKTPLIPLPRRATPYRNGTSHLHEDAAE